MFCNVMKPLRINGTEYYIKNKYIKLPIIKFPLALLNLVQYPGSTVKGRSKPWVVDYVPQFA